MKQINTLTVIVLVAVLGLAACDSRAAMMSVLPTPVSVIPTATSQPTPTQTPTTIPSPSPTEMPTATPTLTPLPTPLPDPLLKGQIGFVAYDTDVGWPCEGSPDGNGSFYFNLYTIAPDGSNLQHWGQFMTRGPLSLSWSPDGRRVLLYVETEYYPIYDPDSDHPGPFPDRHGLYLLDHLSGGVVIMELEPPGHWGIGGIRTLPSYPEPGEVVIVELEAAGMKMYMSTYRGEEIPPIWSPDSEKIAVNLNVICGDKAGRDIYVLDVASRRLMPLVATPSDEAILSWSPDGEWIAYAQWEGYDREPERLRLVVSRADGSAPREVVCCGVFPTNFHWSADSRQLIFPAFNDKGLHLTTVDIEREQPFDVAQLPLSITRADLLYGPGHRNPFDVVQPLPTTPLLYLSPDGSRYVTALEVEGQTDIFVVNADGSGLTNLTRHPANDASPIWSPDGRYIAFVSNRGGARWLRQLYVMRADGSDVRLVSDKCVGPFFWRPQPGE